MISPSLTTYGPLVLSIALFAVGCGDGTTESSLFGPLGEPHVIELEDTEVDPPIVVEDPPATVADCVAHAFVIEGTEGDDVLEPPVGSSPEAVFCILGHGGNDTIRGSRNNDQLFGGAGNDFIDGLAGDDTIDAGPGDDLVDGGSGNDAVFAGAGNDEVHGGSGDDNVVAYKGHNILMGGSGDDNLFTGAGNDVLGGGSGDDCLHGGDGDDVLRTDSADSVSSGGEGRDTCMPYQWDCENLGNECSSDADCDGVSDDTGSACTMIGVCRTE